MSNWVSQIVMVNILSYTPMLNIFTSLGQMEEANNVFNEMMED